MLLKAELLSSVVAVAGLNEKALLVKAEVDLVIAGGRGVLRRGVAETVLGAQFLGDLIVDLGYILILLDLEEAAAGLLGHALEVFLAVSAALAAGIGAPIVAAAVSAAGVATTGIAAAAWIATTARIATAAAIVLGIVLLRLLAFEDNHVDGGVGALGF